VRPQRRAHVLAGRDEEGLPVGGFVLQQLLQQVVVLDTGKIPPAELLTLAVELIRQAELIGVAPTSQKLSIKSMTVERVSEGKIIEHWGQRTHEKGIRERIVRRAFQVYLLGKPTSRSDTWSRTAPSGGAAGP
jgi:hypothetical protein